jgi:ribonuclease HI
MSTYKELDIYIDGACSGNPGDASIGIVFSHGEEPVKNISKYIGSQTNNIAEYTALVVALQEANAMKIKSVRIYSDSELLCRQMNGAYKVKNENLKNLYDQAQVLRRGFENFSLYQIPREKNKGADKLARLAIKKNSHPK